MLFIIGAHVKSLQIGDPHHELTIVNFDSLIVMFDDDTAHNLLFDAFFLALLENTRAICCRSSLSIA